MSTGTLCDGCGAVVQRHGARKGPPSPFLTLTLTASGRVFVAKIGPDRVSFKVPKSGGSRSVDLCADCVVHWLSIEPQEGGDDA